MADITEAIRRLIFEYTSSGADQVMQTQQAVAASTTTTDKASLSLEKTFGNLERRYVETVRHQQDYQKVQQQVNAAVAQNPALQERANVVLAAAGQHYDNLALSAGKGGMAMTLLSRAMSVIIGPAGLIGIAIAGVVTAFVYLEQKLQLIPQALGWVAQALANIGWGQAAQQVAEYADRMRDVAAAAEVQKAALEQIQATHAGVSIEVAKQLQVLEAQLKVAQARTEEGKLTAQYELDIVTAAQQGLGIIEQIEIATLKRQIATEKIAEAEDRAAEAAAKSAEAAEEAADAAAKRADETDEAADAEERLRKQLEEAREELEKMRQAQNQLNTATRELGIIWTQNVADQNMYANVLGGGQREQYGIDSSIAGSAQRKIAAYEKSGTPYTMKSFGMGANTFAYPVRDYGDISASLADLTNTNDNLIQSTDALNATMQSALSPYYSQDPRTTKLGFRAGVVGNQDWLTGATNANPLAAVLGAGATAPGMAGGGSFVVGGGYSANDNKMAVFPVASGEEVVVNRNKEGTAGQQIVNIDNRIVINGPVTDDAISRMKVSRYQQAQRMRAGLAQAS